MKKRLFVCALVLAASALPAHAFADPQPLPEDACNEGTEKAHEVAAPPAENDVPHVGRVGCHTAVP